MSENDSSAFSILAAITLGHADLISRIAAPLWARVGRPIDASELSWSRSMLGESGPQLLVQALQGFDALDPRTRALSARGVSRFLSSLVGDAAHPHTQKATHSPELVWTLPNSHPSRSIRGQTYLDCCLRLVREAKESLTIVSPFIDPAGIGALSVPLLDALSHGVGVRLFVHDALNIGTLTSRALEELRRETDRRGDLSVFSAEAGAGRDRLLNPLLHAKLVIRDDQALLLGSANLTSHALGSNFEAGVLLGETAAREALFILDGILNANNVYLVFRSIAH